MKKVYVAGPISSSNTEQSLKNIRAGVKAGAKLLSLGYSPYVPHLDYQFNLVQDEKIDVETHYKHDLEWLALCGCMLVLDGWDKSKGVKAEIKFAKDKMPIYYSLNELLDNEKV